MERNLDQNELRLLLAIARHIQNGELARNAVLSRFHDENLPWNEWNMISDGIFNAYDLDDAVRYTENLSPYAKKVFIADLLAAFAPDF